MSEELDLLTPTLFQPENIVCSEKHKTDIKIVDFGSAKMMSEEKVKVSS